MCWLWQLVSSRQSFLTLLFPASVQTKFEDGTDMVVTVISAMGEEAVIAVKNLSN